MLNKTKFTCTYYIERNGEEMALAVSGTYYYDPGVLYTIPENCYPPEEELEYTITHNGVEWDDSQLTAHECALLEDEIMDSMSE